MDSTTAIVVIGGIALPLSGIFLICAYNLAKRENAPNFQVHDKDNKMIFDGHSIHSAVDLIKKTEGATLMARPRSIELAIELGIIDKEKWAQRPETENYFIEIPLDALTIECPDVKNNGSPPTTEQGVSP